MRPTSSEFSRDVQPIWRPALSDQAPLHADGSKFHQHFPALHGQSAPTDAGDQLARGRSDDLVGFTTGARIACPEGARLVEDLKIGDLVETMDHGPQPITWIGRKSHAATGDLAPISFTSGALGAEQTLQVGPHQRMHLAMPVMDMLYGFSEGLAEAKYLVNGDTVTQHDGGDVEYIQLLFAAHEIIWANGVATESLFLEEADDTAPPVGGLTGISHLFPDLADDMPQQGAAARPLLEGFEARLAMSYSKSPSDMVLSG